MELKNFDLTKTEAKFFFLNSNRSVSPRKDLALSIREQGVMDPIKVINSGFIDADTPITDIDGREINRKVETGLVILDGQHRYATLVELIRKTKDEKGNTPLKSTVLPCIILSQGEVGNVNSYIITLNSCSRNWKNSDYIDNAAKVQKNDKLIRTIERFQEIGFSLSTISRFVCFNKSRLSTKSLTEYVNSKGEKLIDGADADRACRLYLFLYNKGLQDTVLRKRYIIEYIIRESNVSSLSAVLSVISVLKNYAKINQLRDKDVTKGTLGDAIESIIKEDYNSFKREKNYTQKDIDNMESKDYLAEFANEVSTFLYGDRKKSIKTAA